MFVFGETPINVNPVTEKQKNIDLFISMIRESQKNDIPIDKAYILSSAAKTGAPRSEIFEMEKVLNELIATNPYR